MLASAQPVSVSKRILKEVAVSSAHTLNSLVLLAAIVYSLLSILFAGIHLLAGVGSVGLAKGLLDFSDRVNTTLEAISDKPGYEYLGLGVLLIAFCASLYRSYKKQYSDQFDRKAVELAEGFSSGKLAYTDLPLTADLQAIQNSIREFTDYLNELNEAYKTTPSAQTEEQIRKAKEILELYTDAWYRLDIFRRVKLENAVTANTTLKDDILVFLSSKGLVNTVTNVTGTLSKVALVCTLISLITVQTLQGSRILADQLGETYLTKKLDEARSSFEQVISETTGQRMVSTEDEAVLDEMAADYELLFANSLFEQLSTDDSATIAKESEVFKMRSLVVRQRILNAFVSMAANRSNDPDFNTQPDIADSSLYDLSTPGEKANWKFIRAYTHIESESGRTLAKAGVKGDSFRRRPKTAAGIDFRARMRRDFASKSDVLWTRAKRNFATYKASFHEPIVLNDLRGRLFTEAIGKIADHDVHLTGQEALDDLMKEFVDNVQGDLLEKAHAKMSYEFMEMTARGEAYEDVIKRFKDITPGDVFGGNHRVATMRAEMPAIPLGSADAIAGHHPPSLNPNVKKVNLKEAGEALKNLNGGSVSEGSTAALNSYEDFFPGQMGSEARTSAGQLRRSLASVEGASERLALESAGNALQAAGELISNGLSKAEASFVRSRSYIRLRGFSRIGGVLIGNDPENSTASAKKTGADFVDLIWQNEADNLTISLRNRDKSIVRVGTYPKAIVQQALAYAADGRLTTVTMVSVPPISQLKVLLHPSLVNSKLGLTSMDLDRLVDSFQSPEISKARERVTMWGILYSTAYLERTLAQVTDQEQSQVDQKTLERLRQNQQAKWTGLGKFWPLLRSMMPEDSPADFPFQEKSAYFDMDLLRVIQQVMKTSADVSTFKQKLMLTFKQGGNSNHAAFASEFEVWSGVREQKYSVDKNLSFLQNNTLNPYYPLDFMVQVAFTSVSKPDATDDQEQTDEADMDPWQFPALTAQNAVNLAVMRGINSSPSYKHVLHDMQQFTQLQRVFRLAFRGQLGYDFPLDELLNLLVATKEAVPRVETPEWNQNENAFLSDLAFGRTNTDFATLVRALGVYRRNDEADN